MQQFTLIVLQTVCKKIHISGQKGFKKSDSKWDILHTVLW